jgi:hypothetical protein
MTGYVIFERDSERRLAAAWNAVEAEGKARALEAAGHAVGIATVEVSDGALRAARRPRPQVPYGYRLRTRSPLARSTMAKPWRRQWVWALRDIAAAGDWTTWGHGHLTAPIQNALEARGAILVAVPARGRGRYLFKATEHGRALLAERAAGRLRIDG